MIHYHGTPITPLTQLHTMAGKHFCVSFFRPDQLNYCVGLGQSLMLDNGAYSFYTKQDRSFVARDYYDWLEPVLAAPTWAVIPDEIGGTIEDNLAHIEQWPYPDSVSGVVWHLNESIDHLLRLAQVHSRVCFGSAGEYWDVGRGAWANRVDEAFNALAKEHPRLPWVHMMRGLGLVGERWPFASADSTNVARHCGDPNRRNRDAGTMATEIDAQQCPTRWTERPIQRDIEL